MAPQGTIAATSAIAQQPEPRYVVAEPPLQPADIPVVARKRALLIGINYPGTQAELSGCVNDVQNIKHLLLASGWKDDVAFGVAESSFRVLLDGEAIRANILAGVDWLVRDCRRGDSLFFLYSGHGGQEIHPQGLSEDGMADTLLPVDFQYSGTILDTEMSERLVSRLPEGVKLTALVDACHSGTALDLPWTLLPGQAIWKEETNPLFTAGDVVLLSGCADDQTSSDGGRDRYGRPGGALTTAFCEVLQHGFDKISYAGLLVRLREAMERDGFSQMPQMSSAQAFEADSHVFSLGATTGLTMQVSGALSQQDLIILNRNATLGQIVRQQFPPKPQPFDEDSPLHAMLMDVGMFVTSEMVADAIESLFTGGAAGMFGEGNYANAGRDTVTNREEDPGLMSESAGGGMFGGFVGAVGSALGGGGFDDDDDDY